MTKKLIKYNKISMISFCVLDYINICVILHRKLNHFFNKSIESFFEIENAGLVLIPVGIKCV
jgi:hypothetical protein